MTTDEPSTATAVQRRLRVLLTNDDGVRAPGLLAVYRELAEVADVTVVAPADQRSGHSHMITLLTPLRARRLEELPGFMVDFTPVDCVKLALKELLEEPPDLVVSGCNRGTNAGHLVHYSGTVGAAVEASLNGIPALAVSLHVDSREPDFRPAGRVARLLVQRFAQDPWPVDCVLNVNIPERPLEELKGFRWTRQSRFEFKDDYDRRQDPWGHPYFWLRAGPEELKGKVPEDDFWCVRQGYVAVTPLTIDWTHEQAYRERGGLLDGLDALIHD